MKKKGNDTVKEQPVLFFFYVELQRLSIKTMAAPASQSAAGLARHEISTCRLTSFSSRFERRASPEDWNPADFTSLLSDSFTNLACVFHGGEAPETLPHGIPNWLSGKI
jgi:hypothetical protein